MLIRDGCVWLSEKEFEALSLTGAVLHRIRNACESGKAHRDAFILQNVLQELQAVMRTCAVSRTVPSEYVNTKKALECLGPIEEADAEFPAG